MRIDHRRRHLRLPHQGEHLVSSDLHGQGDDFRLMEALFRERVRDNPDTHWLLLGDLAHGLDPETRRELPELYDYMNESAWIIHRLIRLLRRYPHRVHLLLGNHDYGHIGGRRTAKFYEDGECSKNEQ